MWVAGLRAFNLQISVFVLCAALAGCGLPATAPTISQLEDSLNEAGRPNYTLVNVDERVASILHQYRRPTFGARFKGQRYLPNNRLHPGDIVAVSIFEVGGSSLFGSHTQSAPSTSATPAPGASTSGGAASLPPQVIEADGTIMIPFVGRVIAANKTPAQLGAEIQRRLQGKAVDPQVIVTLVSSVTNTATVGGDVGSPRPIPLTLRGERLLDVIAAAGGAKYPAYEIYVSVVRGGRIGTVLLQSIVTNPAENILVRPDDQIFLTRYPRSFAVLGATAKVSQYTFDTAKVTLAEAVARAGGPIDTVGDPAGIYLFRYESVAMAEKILGKPLPESAESTADPVRGFVPVLYRVDFRKAGGYFLSQDIDMQDKDVVLITNAEVTQLQKALQAVRGVTGIAYDLSRGATQ